MDRDIPRHIVSYKIYAEWNDNPKMVQLDHEMDSDIENSFNQWLQEIEEEENDDLLRNIEDGENALEEIYEALVGDNGMERYTHEELLEYIYEWKKIEEYVK